MLKYQHTDTAVFWRQVQIVQVECPYSKRLRIRKVSDFTFWNICRVCNPKLQHPKLSELIGTQSFGFHCMSDFWVLDWGYPIYILTFWKSEAESFKDKLLVNLVGIRVFFPYHSWLLKTMKCIYTIMIEIFYFHKYSRLDTLRAFLQKHN